MDAPPTSQTTTLPSPLGAGADPTSQAVPLLLGTDPESQSLPQLGLPTRLFASLGQLVSWPLGRNGGSLAHSLLEQAGVEMGRSLGPMLPGLDRCSADG